MKINRMMINVCSQDIEKSKLFYTSLFAFNVNYNSDWFIHLVSEGNGLELGIIAEGHEIVPEGIGGKTMGVYLTFVVDNVDEFYTNSQKLGYKVIQEPCMTPYGQKRMLIGAPEGTVCDVSSPS
ncbi:VOC family protein [Reinekea sp.]|jgi:predicted enzyme related to lactoylglutathione lyase|uniref:VOC family protein n=1 Tax=Reinekea sp. TaxID=1970455 RepID=UPI003989B0CB